MLIGEAKLLMEESGEVACNIPIQNPLMTYSDWVDYIKASLNDASHIQGFSNGQEIRLAQQQTHAYNLNMDGDELILKIRYTDTGNAKESYDLKVYVICDVEEKGGED